MSSTKVWYNRASWLWVVPSDEEQWTNFELARPPAPMSVQSVHTFPLNHKDIRVEFFILHQYINSNIKGISWFQGPSDEAWTPTYRTENYLTSLHRVWRDVKYLDMRWNDFSFLWKPDFFKCSKTAPKFCTIRGLPFFTSTRGWEDFLGIRD